MAILLPSDDEPDTFIDGCGVYPDIEIGRGTRIRLRLKEDRQQDLSLYVQEGALHIFGMYRPLLLGLSNNNNYLSVVTQVWPRKTED